MEVQPAMPTEGSLPVLTRVTWSSSPACHITPRWHTMAMHLALASQPCSGSPGGLTQPFRRKRLEMCRFSKTNLCWVDPKSNPAECLTYLDQLLLGEGMGSVELLMWLAPLL